MLKKKKKKKKKRHVDVPEILCLMVELTGDISSVETREYNLWADVRAGFIPG